MRSVLFAAVVACALALPSVARATDGFPPAIRDHLSLDYVPACTLCHQTLAGGSGTATKPFAQSMRAHGLAPFDTDSLNRALDALEQEHVDSDGDGMPDIEELKAHRDPDVPDGPSDGGAPTGNPAADVPVDARYGCGAEVSTKGTVPMQTLAALAAVALAVALRRRR